MTAMHNKIGKFVGNAIALICSLGCFFVVEQPSSSLLFEFAPVAAALSATSAQRYAVCLGSFGGETWKPLALVGTVPWLPLLVAHQQFLRARNIFPAPRESLAHHENGRVTGRGRELQLSQVYPPEFCRACAYLLAQQWNQYHLDAFHCYVLAVSKLKACLSLQRHLQQFL